MWGDGDRLALPDDFAEHKIDPALDPRWSIYDVNVHDMGEHVAQLLKTPDSRSAINNWEDDSKKLSSMLRHGDNGRVTMFNDGGWVKCSDIFGVDGQHGLRLQLRDMYFLFSATMENDKQRFQLAVLTLPYPDPGGNHTV
eukprot:9378605-Heterocapsa_arctica.AAC.1